MLKCYPRFGKICAIVKLAFGAMIWNISTKNNRFFLKKIEVLNEVTVMNTICESFRGSDDRPLHQHHTDYISLRQQVFRSLGFFRKCLYTLSHKPLNFFFKIGHFCYKGHAKLVINKKL